jgi:endonuclease YncB( thermonuclease family)
MSSDQRWKWAGIVSVISLGGVLLTDIFANVVGGYISDQIKTWQMPEHPPVTPAAQSDTVSSIPPAAADEPQVTMAAVTPRPEAAPMPPIEIPPEAAPVAATAPEPMPLPPPEPRPRPVSGTVEQVIDTGTLKIQGATIALAGVRGLGSPYRDQLAKFIEEQGSQIRCEPIGYRYTCFVSHIDLALAALTNGAARLAPDATPQYRQAENDARRNRRGIFQ